MMRRALLPPTRLLAGSLAAWSLLPALWLALLIPAVAQTPVVLETHEQRPWALPADLERIAVANPEVADVLLLDGRRNALLLGRSPGQTTLLVWRRGQGEPARTRLEVRAPLQAALATDPARVQADGGHALLSGSFPDMLEHERYRQAAAIASGQDAVIDQSSVSAGVVQVEVRVVEFNRNVLRQLGLNFQNRNGGFRYGFTSPGVGRADGGEGDLLSSAFRIALGSDRNSWSASLDLLQSNGMARILAEPTLVALSGQSASFLAGGELPILEPQGLGTTTVAFKPFGIGLTVTPTVLSPDRIALKVAPEASDLDYANGVTLDGVQIPAITTRRADTTVELGDGESFVIGGLVSSTLSSTVDKIPLLGDLPIIGSFFRNLDYRRQERELVIVVTPRLVRPLARGTELTLPGDRETQPRHSPWASWLLHPAGSDPLPGFSR